jgi:hypothetical protein
MFQRCLLPPSSRQSSPWWWRQYVPLKCQSTPKLCEISGSHGGKHEVQSLLVDYTAVYPRRLWASWLHGAISQKALLLFNPYHMEAIIISLFTEVAGLFQSPPSSGGTWFNWLLQGWQSDFNFEDLTSYGMSDPALLIHVTVFQKGT